MENGSSRRITLTTSLRQRVVYTAKGRQRYRKKTLEHIRSDRIAPHATREWNAALQIPATDVLDKRSCSIIDISYDLKVKALIPWGFNLSTIVPVNIGNVLLLSPSNHFADSYL